MVLIGYTLLFNFGYILALTYLSSEGLRLKYSINHIYKVNLSINLIKLILQHLGSNMHLYPKNLKTMSKMVVVITSLITQLKVLLLITDNIVNSRFVIFYIHITSNNG